MSNKDIKIYGTLLNHTTDNKIAYARQIYDERFKNGMFQDAINERVNAINYDNGVTIIDGPVNISGKLTPSEIETNRVKSSHVETDTLKVNRTSSFLGNASFANASFNDATFRNASFHDIEAANIDVDGEVRCDSCIVGQELRFGYGVANAGLTLGGDIWPDDSDAVHNLGTQTNKWDNLYVKDIHCSSDITACDIISNGYYVLTEEDLNSENGSIKTVIRSITATEIAKVVANAPQDFDTLKEIADWISGHSSDAAAMNSQISTNTSDITNIQSRLTTIEGQLDGIDQSLANYYTKSDCDNKFALATSFSNYYNKSQIDQMLADIEAGAGSAYIDEELECLILNATNGILSNGPITIGMYEHPEITYGNNGSVETGNTVQEYWVIRLEDDTNNLEIKPFVTNDKGDYVNPGDGNLYLPQNTIIHDIPLYEQLVYLQSLIGIESKSYSKQESDNKYLTSSDLSDYYTKSEIDTKVSGLSSRINIINSSLSNYYVKDASDARYLQSSALDNYYTKSEVDAIALGEEVDLSDYYTKSQVDGFINGIQNSFGNYYNKTASDERYLQSSALNSYYTKTESDERYLQSSALNNYYTKSEVDAIALGGEVDLSDYYTKSEVDGFINGIQNSFGNYYTKTAADERYLQSSDLSNYYTKSEVDAIALGGEVDLSGYYTKTEVDGFVSSLQSSISSVETTANGAQSSLSSYYTKTESDGRFLNVSTINAAKVTMTADISDATCPVTLANKEFSTVVYKNTDSSEHTLTISNSYISPDGQQIQLTVPAGGYAEVSYMKVENEIYVRGL